MSKGKGGLGLPRDSGVIGGVSNSRAYLNGTLACQWAPQGDTGPTHKQCNHQYPHPLISSDVRGPVKRETPGQSE